MTFAKACSHIANFTSAHESGRGAPPPKRFHYPDQHIEVDNRLTWFLGSLAVHYPDARYIHLHRDPDLVAHSFLARWHSDPPALIANASRHPLRRVRSKLRTRHPGGFIIPAFAYGVMQRSSPWAADDRAEVCRFYVDTVTESILEFVRDKPCLDFALEDARDAWPLVWDWIGAEGDFGGALAEFDILHNATV